MHTQALPSDIRARKDEIEKETKVDCPFSDQELAKKHTEGMRLFTWGEIYDVFSARSGKHKAEEIIAWLSAKGYSDEQIAKTLFQFQSIPSI